MEERYIKAFELYLTKALKEHMDSVINVKVTDSEYYNRLNVYLDIDENILVADILDDNSLNSVINKLESIPLEPGVELPYDMPAGRIDIIWKQNYI